MAKNADLGAAKTAKKDEFYTQLTDILAFHPFKVLVDVCLCKLHLAARVLLIVADFSLLPQVIQR